MWASRSWRDSATATQAGSLGGLTRSGRLHVCFTECGVLTDGVVPEGPSLE
jgi:hypothetical protein